jgi:hypothetical protein
MLTRVGVTTLLDGGWRGLATPVVAKETVWINGYSYYID